MVDKSQSKKLAEGVYPLPSPVGSRNVSVEAAIASRRSVRSFTSTSLDLGQIAALLWAAQGVTDATHGRRSAPSAGALYPVSAFIMIGEGGAEEIPAGVYLYLSNDHCLALVTKGDLRKKVRALAWDQEFLTQAPVTIVFAAEYDQTKRRYGERAARYVDLEIGHAAQNVMLQAGAMGLGTVAVGAFSDEEVHRALGLDERLRVVYLVPVGVPAITATR